MKRCKTCKWWWEEKERAFVLNDSANTCMNSTRVGDLGTVELNREDTLQYSYNESGMTYTGPEFGCVHHEEKNTGKPRVRCGGTVVSG